MLAYLCIMAARSLEGVRWAERALRLDPTGSGTDMIRYLQLIGWATAGRPDDALKLAVGLPDPAHASIAELDALLGRGLVRTWTDDLAGAQADLVGLVAACRDRSAAFRILALTALGQVEFRRGHWDDALVHAEVAASLANDTDQLWVAPYAHATAAFVLAGRGAWTEAEAHLVAGWAATSGPDYPPQMVYPALAEALMRRAQGDSVGVVRALRSLLAFENLDGFNEPGVVPWHDVLADALVAIGEYQEAAALLGRWETRVAERGRRSVQLAVSRARGNLAAAQGDQHAAEEAFRAGLRYAEQVDEPFGRALLQAAYGGFLRRSGQRSAAAAQLKAARATFAQLEAHPYLERCERELAGCGLTPAKRGERSSVGLTPQELAVARLAATGLTNRQVAAELIVSVKTVEYHLAKVYAKLAIGSRAELGTRLKS
jgi:ATP/maltotriose-dependent transcriptional regulator MalT